MREMPLARLRSLLRYEPDTGHLYWLTSRGRRTDMLGKRAGSVNSYGYVYVVIDRQHYPAHRLAWALVTGSWPKETIDHVNRLRSDNRWVNLREASRSQQNGNRPLQKNNISGYRGVSRAGRRWASVINIDKAAHHLGTFSSKEEAAAAYTKRARAHFGEFFNE